MVRRSLSLRTAALLAALLIVLTASDCNGGDDRTNTTTQNSGETIAQTICRLRSAAGDTDCDGVLNRYDKTPGRNDFRTDSDNDAVVDAFDRFQGNDYGDADRDGWANWVDGSPFRAEVTVSSQVTNSPSAQAAGQAQQQALEQREAQQLATEEQRLANENAKLAFLNQQLDRELKDSDGDRISDINDTQTNLHYSEDRDNDGTVNGRDRFPLNDGYE